jgi:hypothetical protein
MRPIGPWRPSPVPVSRELEAAIAADYRAGVLVMDIAAKHDRIPNTIRTVIRRLVARGELTPRNRFKSYGNQCAECAGEAKRMGLCDRHYLAAWKCQGPLTGRHYQRHHNKERPTP